MEIMPFDCEGVAGACRAFNDDDGVLIFKSEAGEPGCVVVGFIESV